jgi:hypothetical protein
MSSLNRSIDAILSMSQMPSEYVGVRAEVLCNDCERRCITKYHFMYHKCIYCGGYNTKLIRSFAAEQEASVMQSPVGMGETDIIMGVEQVVQRTGTISPPLLDDVLENSDDD